MNNPFLFISVSKGVSEPQTEAEDQVNEMLRGGKSPTVAKISHSKPTVSKSDKKSDEEKVAEAAESSAAGGGLGYNPYRDEEGRFTSPEGAVSVASGVSEGAESVDNKFDFSETESVSQEPIDEPDPEKDAELADQLGAIKEMNAPGSDLDAQLDAIRDQGLEQPGEPPQPQQQAAPQKQELPDWYDAKNPDHVSAAIYAYENNMDLSKLDPSQVDSFADANLDRINTIADQGVAEQQAKWDSMESWEQKLAENRQGTEMKETDFMSTNPGGKRPEAVVDVPPPARSTSGELGGEPAPPAAPDGPPADDLDIPTAVGKKPAPTPPSGAQEAAPGANTRTPGAPAQQAAPEAAPKDPKKEQALRERLMAHAGVYPTPESQLSEADEALIAAEQAQELGAPISDEEAEWQAMPDESPQEPELSPGEKFKQEQAEAKKQKKFEKVQKDALAMGKTPEEAHAIANELAGTSNEYQQPPIDIVDEPGATAAPPVKPGKLPAVTPGEKPFGQMTPADAVPPTESISEKFHREQKERRKFDSTYKQARGAGYSHEEAHAIANDAAGSQFPDEGERQPTEGEKLEAASKMKKQYDKTYKQARLAGFSHEEAHQIANEHSGGDYEDQGPPQVIAPQWRDANPRSNIMSMYSQGQALGRGAVEGGGAASQTAGTFAAGRTHGLLNADADHRRVRMDSEIDPYDPLARDRYRLSKR